MGIKSTLTLINANKDKVFQLLTNLKKIEDIPYTRFDIKDGPNNTLQLEIVYPTSVFDHSVAQFLALLFGETAFMREFGSVRFDGIELPEEVYTWFKGPKFGVDGIAERFAIKQFPVLVAIIKPSLGPQLQKDVVQGLIQAALRGGFHAVKDDEMQNNLPTFTIEERLTLAEQFFQYIPAVNSDNLSQFQFLTKNRNIGMLLVNGSVIGFPFLHEISVGSKSPILSHLAFQGNFQTFGPRLFSQLHRLFGCDALITPIGDAGYYNASKEDERTMVEALTKDLPIKKTLPLLTGGARKHNLESIIAYYEQHHLPYGVVFGTYIFASGGDPAERAREIVQEVSRIKQVW